MPFQPEVNQELVIDHVTYRIAEHPSAPGMPYGQEGRQAIVYQLVAPSPDAGEGRGGGPDQHALKVFKPRYRSPALVGQADRIAPLATLPGLQVCQRTVLSARRHGGLLRQYPDLTYAVLMPWIEGPTWMEIMVGKRELQPEQSLALARALAEILAGMEEHGLAHCDLSGPNVLLPILASGEAERPAIRHSPFAIELVDVEQLHGSDLRRPELLPGGSPGYAHKTAPDGLWGSTADRFAGAVILGEMLGWCDERVRGTTWGENYFDPQEMQQDSEWFRTLVTVLQERWGAEVARLSERAWRSEMLTDCATFGEWLVTLPQRVPAVAPLPLPVAKVEETLPEASEMAVRALMDVARRLEGAGNLAGALENYRQAQAMAAPESGPAEELRLIVQDLEAKLKAQTVPAPVAAERPTLDVIFDDGSMACQRGEWAKAKELLSEVVRQQPDYERDGQRAERLLMEAESRLVPARHRLPRWAWGAIAGALALLIVGGGLVLFSLRTPAAGATRTRPADGMVMVYVPAGPFLMGSDPAIDSTALENEQPQHQVNLSAFWIDRTEVSNDQYEACVRVGACAPSAYARAPAYGGTDYPVVGAGWEDARAYCRWVGGDLPTEAQWEKAARGTDGRIFPWGNEFDGTRVNFCDANCPSFLKTDAYDDGYEQAAPADSFWSGASPYGAFHMAGNVYEWTLDCFDHRFYDTVAATGEDPVNDRANCGEHTLRGGGWLSTRHACRSAYRVNEVVMNVSGEWSSVGFRCAIPATLP